ncbi:MAG: hypothetical protein EBU90_07725 [Proteobacteria bacterium]|nr:hypothetical protein [Pseudomonadota bacterium]NBP14087.1 hypothetical protein [bacterium]
MRAREFLKEQSDNLSSLKSIIGSKIKELPPTQEALNALEEIQDLLSTINLGGRRRSSSTDFGKWSDKDVVAAKDTLARYIVSLDAPIAYRKSMLEQWKSNGLIDVDLLLSGTHTMEEIVKGYGTNPAVKELADDLIRVSDLGVGKGEFFLQVLSPRITNPQGGKGDIFIEGLGTVEVKTTDGGAGRLTDRQVKPGSGYQAKVNQFYNDFSGYLQVQSAANTPSTPEPTSPTSTSPQTNILEAKKPKEPKPPKPITLGSGFNLSSLISLKQKLPPEKIDNMKTQLTEILEEIFLKSSEYIPSIINAIMAGQEGKAKQIYAVGILNNYMAHKTDKGMLYISLNKIPNTFTFFTDNASLNEAGFRLHVSTFYPVTKNPEYAYPQTSIVPTSQAQPSI